MRSLITGVSGFVGKHLATYLARQGTEIHGIDRHPLSARPDWLADASCFTVGDLTDPSIILEVLKRVQPTHVFHLAGVLGNAPGGSIAQYQSNVLATVHLLDAICELRQNPTILISSSSAVYGAALQAPITEEQPYRPLTPYAASKAAQELTGLQAFLSRDLPVVLARTFNLVGPGQSRALVTSEIAYQIVLAERGGTSSVQVGNVAPRRDYTDVRDAVRAYSLMASHAEPGRTYNVCSGHSRSILECADILMTLARVPVSLKTDLARVRAVEIQDQIGDPTRILEATGWKPQIPLEISLCDLLDDWRQRIVLDKEGV